MKTGTSPTLAQRPQPDVLIWDHYRALREQWTHEDNLVAQRMGWLIWSEGLMFTAYGAHGRDEVYWLVLGFPFFGILVAVLAGVAIYSAMSASDSIKQQFDESGLGTLCQLAPAQHIAHRGRWAAKAMPYVFGAMWLLALLGRLSD
jgi:hypothetical protein